MRKGRKASRWEKPQARTAWLTEWLQNKRASERKKTTAFPPCLSCEERWLVYFDLNNVKSKQHAWGAFSSCLMLWFHLLHMIWGQSSMWPRGKLCDFLQFQLSVAIFVNRFNAVSVWQTRVTCPLITVYCNLSILPISSNSIIKWNGPFW